MSDIRKAIMARLGEFARPGAKAEMGFVGSAGHAGAMAARGMRDGAAAYRAGKPAVLNRLDSEYRGWSDKDLEVYGNFWMRGWTGEQMKDMTTRDPKRGTDLPGSRFSRPGAKARFEENCGTGAGGFKPGNKCGVEDGKGGGGGPEDKKRKPKRTPLAGPKVEKPAKIPSRTALNNLAQNAPEYQEDWQDAKDALSGRTDPQSTKLRNEMLQVSERWSQLQDAIDNLYAVPIKKNREADLKKRKDIGDELNLLQQRAKRIIRDVGKSERTAKRSPIEQARNLVYRTLKAQEALGGWSKGLLSDVGDALSDLQERGGAGSGKMRKALKAMEEEWRGLQRETDAISTNYIDMKEKQPDNEQEARALTQRAGQLLQKTGDWRKRAQELVKQVKARASRTGDRRLFALAVRAQKILARRPGVKAQMGLLDRIGTVATAAVSAATAKPFDPTNPQVAKDLEAAKRAAITEVNNYKFFKEFNDAQFKALDDYVKATAKSIAGLRSSQDVARLTDGIKQAVAARNLIRKTLKTPFAKKGGKDRFAQDAGSVANGFSRPGAKAKMGSGYARAITPYLRGITFRMEGDIVVVPDAQQQARAINAVKKARRDLAIAEEPMVVVRPNAAFQRPTASRLGAKATAEKPERKAKNCTVDAKPLAYGKGDGALEREDVKAGLKLMEKADAKISEKIRTLIKEGKPQDQAVAIALDMKRRGEL